MTQVDVSPFSPLIHYPDSFHDYAFLVDSFKESVFDDINYEHTHDSWNVSFTFKHEEEKYSLPDLSRPSSDHCEETKSEILCFQSPPLYDSSNHEDPFHSNDGIYDQSCCHIFIDSDRHNFVFSTVNFSEPLVFDDIPFNVLKLLQVVKALQPTLMFMSGSHSVRFLGSQVLRLFEVLYLSRILIS